MRHSIGRPSRSFVGEPEDVGGSSCSTATLTTSSNSRKASVSSPVKAAAGTTPLRSILADNLIVVCRCRNLSHGEPKTRSRIVMTTSSPADKRSPLQPTKADSRGHRAAAKMASNAGLLMTGSCATDTDGLLTTTTTDKTKSRGSGLRG